MCNIAYAFAYNITGNLFSDFYVNCQIIESVLFFLDEYARKCSRKYAGIHQDLCNKKTST
ncbi:3-isopropylmalate dehydratase small subunit [Dialister micraerophilus DSM 19965]|uniref:3-isopropylmalate dehydratase small subunit n=1 Tax=Dialister micraerophilus DSM 19965 TaxID=888062 RepID=F2BWK0_9FIRM|nr:3-isopropylmalate dehydratase small subunit [Dialister micraerophilus DSM 19965]